jgi:hypothetical protein
MSERAERRAKSRFARSVSWEVVVGGDVGERGVDGEEALGFEGGERAGGAASEEERRTKDIPGLVGAVRLYVAGASEREAAS